MAAAEQTVVELDRRRSMLAEAQEMPVSPAAGDHRVLHQLYLQLERNQRNIADFLRNSSSLVPSDGGGVGVAMSAVGGGDVGSQEPVLSMHAKLALQKSLWKVKRDPLTYACLSGALCWRWRSRGGWMPWVGLRAWNGRRVQRLGGHWGLSRKAFMFRRC